MDQAITPLTPPAGFQERIESLGVAFDEGDIERLGRFLAILLDANTRFNLTSVTDNDEAWERHIFDSLTLMPFIASADAESLADVGSGGGPPGLPLAIVNPSIRFTLIESTGKKAKFLEETAATLGLANITVIKDRAEVVGRDRKQHREMYDIVTARAVGKLPILLELTVPLARVGGHVLAIKGEKANEEIEASKEALYRLHSHVIDTQRTPTGTIVVIEKQRRTPKMYPRGPGEPKRVPLGGKQAVRELTEEGGK